MNTITSFYKKGLKGFTLIELLVVIAIIGLLSTIIAAPITQARKKGRDGKKVADLRQMVNSLQQYADDNNGQYPYSISLMTPKYLSNIPPNAEDETLAKDKYMYVVYSDTDVFSEATNASSTIGFHLGTKMEAISLSLKDDRDCMGVGDVVSSGNHYCVDVASIQAATQSSASSTATNLGQTGFANWVSDVNSSNNTGVFPLGITTGDIGSRAAVASSSFFQDFSGGFDDELANCDASTLDDNTATTTCVYDVTN